jgi:hypothetical protein
MDNTYRRVPPLFWLRRLPGHAPLKLSLSGKTVFCFFSTEDKALDYQEHHTFYEGRLGREWDIVGTDVADHLLLMCSRAPQEGGFDAYVIDPSLDLSRVSAIRPWEDLRVSVERKLEQGAAW